MSLRKGEPTSFRPPDKNPVKLKLTFQKQANTVLLAFSFA
jgi:hypothetical protein